MSRAPRVVAISGGIGGAKLALGLYKSLPADTLMVVCNTGDDFEHLGLYVSPDLDTVMYTLSGIANPETGWGRAGESWNFMAALEQLGGEVWFQLGDLDLATHVERTSRLRAGTSLISISRDFGRRFGARADIVPMCDRPVRTMVETEEYGVLPFQRYFVEKRSMPKVKGF
ncbi:MAG: 2-phospho-L-lactate transferase CofD family protein, partial [Geminicoccaceae bacterium]